MRLTFLLALSTGLLAGCTPHDAEMTGGTYLAYFAAASSQNILAQQQSGADFREQATLDKYGFVPVDCRDLGNDDSSRLPTVDYDADCLDENGDLMTASYYLWLSQYAYYKKEVPTLDPYRIEVVKTSEGDIQFTAHVDAGKLGDFRFGWVVDPNFQPTDCVDAGDGTSELVDVDGDWIQNWSNSDPDGGTLYHLNAYAYQVNPSTPSAYWGFDRTWQAGYAFGRYGEEEMYGHQIEYVDPFLTSDAPYGAPYYYLSYTGNNALVGSDRYNNYSNWAAKFQSNFDEGEYDDFGRIGKADFVNQIRVEDNAWRIADDAEADTESTSNYSFGLENWVGVDPTWVHFDATPEEIRALETGNLDKPLTGKFQVFLEPLSSASKVFVQGSFSIDHIRKDVWGYDRTLDEIKRDENDTPTCGENRLTY